MSSKKILFINNNILEVKNNKFDMSWQKLLSGYNFEIKITKV